jgi:short-subunit dehydrogenase
MGPPAKPYQPYAAVHETTNGPGDARPDWMQVLKDCDAIGKLKGKTVLITGCSAGLGIETAKAMYETGATCFFTARDMKKLDGIIEDIVKNAVHNKDGPKPQPIEMHLDSLDSVRKGAEDFKQKSGGKLNILINNASFPCVLYHQDVC